MTVSPELARIYVMAPSDDELIETLQLYHPSFTAPTFYITNYPEPFLARIDATAFQANFLPFPFQVQLPSSGEDGFEDLTISISNVSRQFVDEIERAIKMPRRGIEFTYRAYAKSVTSGPGFELPILTSSDITVNESSIYARASFADLVNRQFPNQLYTPDLFPMLGDQA